MEDGTVDDSVESMKKELTRVETKAEILVEMPSSEPIGYYLKHKINEKLIKGLVDNHKYNNTLLATCFFNGASNTFSIGRLKHVNGLINQGSDVNVMPISIYNRLTNEKTTGTDIRLSLASHSYIYPLGIAEDVLIDIAGYVYPVDFGILDIKEDKNKPFILGMPFLTTNMAKIKFDKGTVTLKSGKNKVIFDEDKPGSSYNFRLDDSFMTI
uniref:Reverse transcriptase domain-containing protein n=1 Tax=Tanacetum cinerariifolium TaxID=118510 RepID=A0A699I6N9_TANCI|nr:hypothetical protein [Tanacetum cinerariifolium]